MTTKAVEMTTMWTVTESPIGDLRIVARQGTIAAIEFSPFRGRRAASPSVSGTITTRCCAARWTS